MSSSEDNIHAETQPQPAFFDEKVGLPNLEVLIIERMKNLREIWHYQIASDSLNKLKNLKIEYCDELKNIFPPMVTLPNLEVLTIKEMKNMREIWHHQLASYSFSKLKELEISSCDELMNIFPSMVIFPNLTKLTVMRCEGLKCMFSYSMVKSLMRLQHLVILSCNSMTCVFDTTSTGLEFPSLLHLEINHCPNLRRFISMNSSEDNIHAETQPQPAFFDEKVTLPNLEVLTIKEMKNMREIWHHQLASYSFSKLKELEISSCDELMNIFPSMVRLPNLEVLTIYSMKNLRQIWHHQLVSDSFSKLRNFKIECCDELMNIFPPMVTLPNLEVLTIKEMKNMREIWHHQLASYSFSKLKELEISSCDELMNIFPSMVRLPSLEVLNICWMKNLREIWHHQLASDSFSKLKELEIKDCDKIMNIIPPMVTLPNLEVLRIERMNNLREIWHHQLASDSFSKLKELEIYSCDELMNIFPPMMEFPNLVSLSVSYCNKIEEIIGEEVQENLIAFNQLKRLALYELPRLVSFCLGNYTLQFPSLERVNVEACPNMKIFSQGVLHTPKLHEVRVAYYDYDDEVHWEGNLNSTIQKMFKEMVGFLNIWRLKLSLFPSLREKWHGQELPFSFFNNLRSLVVDDCMNMSTAIPANMLRCLNNLQVLEVRNCDSLEAVFYLEEQSGDEQFGPLFPTLYKLELIDLPKLKRFCNFTGNIIELPSLSTMQIVNCPKMVTFISDSTHVRSDKETQEMTTEQNAMLADMKPLFDEKVAFPILWSLKLSKLPELLHLWKENSQHSQVLKKLKYLEVTECGKLEDLLPASVSFQNLRTLEVSKCDGLLNLMTLSTAESLVNLKRMNITDCKKIEKIIQQVGVEEKKNCIVFDKMEYLILHCLPSLVCFCLGNPTLEFSSLKRVVVSECPKMKTFSDGVLHTPKLHKLQVKKEEEEEDDDEGRWEGSLNSTLQQLFKEMSSKED